jgi:hypothetical protein
MCSVYPFPPPDVWTMDMQGVCIHLHNQQCGRVGCIHLRRKLCKRAGCISVDVQGKSLYSARCMYVQGVISVQMCVSLSSA